jgi:hypothetical protein
MQNKDLWVQRGFVARVLGISSQTFDDAIRPRLSDTAATGAGRNLRFDLSACVAALVTYRLEQQKPAASEDPMLVGGDSPNLERYRAAKAALAEMELEEKKKTHASLKDLNDALMRFASLVRRGGEILQRKFGNQASDILNESIDEAHNAWTKEWHHRSADGPNPQPN